MFIRKNILAGLAASIFLLLSLGDRSSGLESVSLLLLTTTVSSYAAMNFTGATPFTSPSGVEKEMRQAIPIQIIAFAAAIIAWVAVPFIT